MTVTRTPSVQRVLGIVLGVLLLGALVGLAVLLPKAQGETGLPGLADELPGGWTAIDVLDDHDPPEGVAEIAVRQREQLEYVEETYAEVYDEAPEVRAYTDETFQSYAVVTLFPTSGAAFAPPEGVVDGKALGMDRDPVDLVRRGDALCAAEYQPVAAGQGTEESHRPTSITCQQPGTSRTLQVHTQGVSVDDTFALLEGLAVDLL